MPKVKATATPSKKPGKPNADTTTPFAIPLPPNGYHRWPGPALKSTSLWHHAQSGVALKETETEEQILFGQQKLEYGRTSATNPLHSTLFLSLSLFSAPESSSKKKKMSAYNTFMKEELPKYKAKHPDVEHKEAFKQVAILWKNSSLNPKKGQ
ncbi:MAG: hypothetical protein J3Q66DRAFT_385049 [Benniella sp.]|nr:MAG: hypothetical protein J3Q66DRAFT_385049 [Benniella sp.]